MGATPKGLKTAVFIDVPSSLVPVWEMRVTSQATISRLSMSTVWAKTKAPMSVGLEEVGRMADLREARVAALRVRDWRVGLKGRAVTGVREVRARRRREAVGMVKCMMGVGW